MNNIDYKEIYYNNNYKVEEILTFSLEDIQNFKEHKIFQKNFAIITACNPNNEHSSCCHSHDEHHTHSHSCNHDDEKRNYELSLDLRTYNYLGCTGYLDNHSEEGFLIFDISFEDAIKLASKYEQYAIFYNDISNNSCGYYEVETKKLIV